MNIEKGAKPYGSPAVCFHCAVPIKKFRSRTRKFWKKRTSKRRRQFKIE